MQQLQDKKFFKALLSLALPIALSDLLKFGLNLMDNVMVGAVGELELSAVTQANQPFFVFSLMMFGLTSGGTVLLAQYDGKGDRAGISRVISIILSIALMITVVWTAAVMLFPKDFMHIFTPEEQLVKIGVRYLRIIGWTYLCYGISSTLMITLRSLKITRFALGVSACAFFTNVFLNWVLIFGNLGAPALGVEGAALATLCARIGECVALVLYARFHKTFGFRFKQLFHFDRAMLRDFFRFAMPVTLNETLWGVGTCMIVAILGRLGSSAVAAASITSAVQQVASVLLFGIGGAATVVIGNYVGAGETTLAHRYAHMLLVLSMVVGAVFAGLVVLLREAVLSLYALDAVTRELSKEMMLIAAAALFFESVGVVCVVGILRGGGDIRVGTYIDTGVLCGVAVPLGALFGLVLGLPVPAVYAALRVDTLLRMLLCLWRVRSGKWMRNITREIV